MTDIKAQILIDIGTEFSAYPSGRFPSDGDHNGEVFREKFLAPALNRAVAQNTVVVVDIDGVRSFGSSFLEEAFAGLIRLGLFSRAAVSEHLTIRSTKPHLSFFRAEIEDLLRTAVPERARAS